MAIPVSYGSMLHISPTNYHLLASKQKSYQKALVFTKNTEEVSGGKKKVRRMDQWAGKRKKTKQK